MRNRSIGQHNMNTYSGRSHTILTVHITSEQQVNFYLKKKKKESNQLSSFLLYRVSRS